jgi:hypothetical protein
MAPQCIPAALLCTSEFMLAPKCDPHAVMKCCPDILHGGHISRIWPYFEPSAAPIRCWTCCSAMPQDCVCALGTGRLGGFCYIHKARWACWGCGHNGGRRGGTLSAHLDVHVQCVGCGGCHFWLPSHVAPSPHSVCGDCCTVWMVCRPHGVCVVATALLDE